MMSPGSFQDDPVNGQSQDARMPKADLGKKSDSVMPSKPAGSKWTDSQWRAVVQRGQNVLVAAAAGSGKTAVLVERIIRRVSDEEQPVDVDRLLIATFTKAAAAEMRHRIGDALESALFSKPDSDHLRKQLALLSRASITTLHSFCMEVIRRYFHMIDLDPGFRVADDTEAALMRQEELDALLEEHYGEAPEEHPFWTLVEWFGGDRSDLPLMNLIERLYEASRSHPFPARWLEEMSGMYAGSGNGVNGGEKEQADRHPWFGSLLKDVRLELDGLAALLEEALGICALPAGPAPYAATLEDELALVRYLVSAAQNGWQALYDGFQTAAFGKLKPMRGDGFDKELQEQVKKLRNEAKEKLGRIQEELFVRTPEDYYGELNRMAPLMTELSRLTEEFAERYRLAKKDKGLLDFTDLEHMCLSILGKPSEDGHGLLPTQAALAYREQFEEVMLDEYQDTNLVQETIVSLISRPAPGNRFMVGDVKQSIYRFRLAEPGLFLAKYALYKTGGGAGADGERIDLAQNFRSRRQVVDSVNDLFRRIMRSGVGEMDYDRDAELVFGAAYLEQGGRAGQASEPQENGNGGRGPVGAPAMDHTAELVLIDKDKTDYSEGLSSGGEEDSGVSLEESGEGEGTGPEEEREELETAQLEARYIGRRICGMMGMNGEGAYPVTDKNGERRPAQFRDFVILLRATRGWASILIEELAAMGIPAYADINTGYFAATEVETVLSLLKVIDNPRQDIPLAAVLRSPLVGLSAEELAQVRLADRQEDFYSALKAWIGNAEQAVSVREETFHVERPAILLPYGVERESAWNEAAASAENAGHQALAHKLLQFQKRLESWRREARQGSLSELISGIYRETGYYDYAGGLPGGSQRQANLRALYDRSRQYEATSFRGLFRFLRFVERMRESGGDLGTARALGEQEDVVRIMSIHKSKGLEFPVVFVAGANKLFNLMDLNGSFLIHKELGFGPKYTDTGLRAVYPTLPQLAIRRRMRMETLAEEMRVLYVALTRAKEKLVLTGTVSSLTARLGSWMRGMKPDVPYLPDYKLAGARSYLDWIMPAVLQHPEALAGLTANYPSLAEAPCASRSMDASSPWRLLAVKAGSLASSVEAGWQAADADGQQATLEAVRSLVPVEAAPSSLRAEVWRRLEWEYPYRDASGMLSKTSVSELKRLDERRVLTITEEGFDWEAPLLHLLEQEKPLPSARGSSSAPLYRLPRFRKARKLTPAETGTIYHTVMQHMPIGKQLDAEEINSIFTGLMEKGILTEEERTALDAEVIAAFFATDIGRRLSSAKEVRRELPFSFGLKAVEVYPDCSPDTANETVLIQGVIDCVFEDESGRLVLVDYKTDRINQAETGELAKRYRLQLDLYGRAIEKIWKRKLDEKIIFYFDGARVIHI
jgi:ATP-dependent helicase/nuclease subunit A